MNNSKLNKTIYSYATSKNYEGAIMLTAEWGAGKSYYLQNELIPYLQEQSIKTIVVSLHGLKNEFEISKAIYVEYLLSKKGINVASKKLLSTKKKKKVVNYSAFTAKTIVKGVASFFNIDLSCSEKDLEKIYNSIDLSNTLVVFEDVERSKMDVDGLLAFINNLVEYDRVKVVLITFEKELKKNNEEKYKSIKEKTVGDTLLFVGDTVKAIDNMLDRFTDENIGAFLEKENHDSALSKEIIKNIKDDSINLRSIMFGLEKFSELMQSIDANLDDDFEKELLISCLTFVHKFRKDSSLKWEENEDVSAKLSSLTYPLHRFIYDFIVSNDCDFSKLMAKEKEYREYLLISKATNDLNNRLSILYNCYVEKEETVKDVILFVRDSLEKKGVIPFELYFKLANYLVYAKYMIGFETVIDECLDLMLSNISALKEDQFDNLALYGGIALNNEEAARDYNAFREKASAIVKKNRMNPLDFSYKVEDVEAFCDMANKSRDSYLTKRGFAMLLDIDKLINLMKNCSSLQLNMLRGVFLNIYAPSNIRDFFLDDKNNLIDLHNKASKLNNYSKFDGIQKHQMKLFINNLEEILLKLDRGY